MKTIKILILSGVFLSTTLSVAQKSWSNNRYSFNSDGGGDKMHLNIDDHTAHAVEFSVGNSIDHISFLAPKVGIGTRSPSEKLEVSGKVKATQFIGDGSQLTGIITTGDFGSSNITTAGKLNFGTSTRQMINLYTNVYGIGIQSFTQYFRSDSHFAWYRGGVHVNEALNPGSGGTAHMVLMGNGSLGVGTTNPSEKLEVSGNVKATQFIGDGSRLTNVNASGDFGDTDITTDGHVHVGGTLPAIPSRYGVYVGNHEDVHTPVLDLVGNVDALIDFTGTSNDFKGRIKYNYSDDAFYVHTNALNSPALTIDNTQKTTIGTTYGDLNTKLDVKGLATLSNSEDNYLRLGHGGSNSFIGFYGNGNLDFRSVQNNLMRLTQGGNLGIGTTTPSEKLEVVGNVKAAGMNLEGDGANTNTIDSNIDGTIVFGGEDGSTITNAQIADSFYPDFSVWVEEGIVTEDIAVAPSSEWDGSQPDYVFETDYELPSLEDVEVYVTSYKHLEGIPSKAEVAEKGWSLPSMDQKLLKKVEELTLYTIQQEKEIKALKALVENLVETIKN